MRPPKSRLLQRVRTWPRSVLIAVGTIAGLLLAARIALPFVVKHHVNAGLRAIPGYTGSVDRIDLDLWRGAYRLVGLAVHKEGGKVKEPFILARSIDFSIAWRELFHGKIVSEIYVEQGRLTFVQGATEEESQIDADRRWQQPLQELFPIDITYFVLTDGILRFQDTTRTPPVDVFIRNLRVVATGLRNRAGQGGREFPAEITLEGDSLGAGKVKALVSAEPLAAQPHFHLSLTIDGVNLVALNDELLAYANVDVGRGTFHLAAEMAANDGGFQGYIKPFFEDLDFSNRADRDRDLGSRAWETIVSGFAWLVKNKARDQVGTRIPFEGRFEDPKVEQWTMIANLFRHGFIRAFNPTVDGTVHARDIGPDGQSAPSDDPPAAPADPAVREPQSNANRIDAATGPETLRPPK